MEQLHQAGEGEQARLYQIGIQQGEGGLQSHDAHGAFFQSPALFLGAVGRMVGGEDVDGAIQKALHELFSADFKVTVLGEGELEGYGKPADETFLPGTEEYTFERFVVGASNKFAHAAALAVAERPAQTYNPLFIYGKSGLGKTHLMRAIQNYIEETRPSMRTVYVDAQDFVSKYSEAGAIKDQEKVSFRNFRAYYEQADILLLDDVQHLQGKKESMNMLFQLFNTLTSQGKQVVLSADRAPKNIQFDERLKSRFYSGGTIDIQPPEVETKLGIVKSFTDEFSRSEGLGNFTLSDDIQMYIAENSGSNIRELKGAVNTVIYRMIYCDRSDISIDEVRELLANHFTGGMSRSLTVEDIQREVENFFKVSHSDMVGPKRSQSIVRPRQIAIYLCRQLLDLPYGDIGKKFNRDHSTAIHSATSIEERLKTDRDTQEEIEVLQKIICELD